MRAAHPDGLSAIFDLVGDKAVDSHLADLLRPGGALVSMLGGADVETLAARGLSGVNVSTQATTEKLQRLVGLVEAGTLRRPQIRTFGLPEAGDALTEVAGHHVRGKLVVVP